MEKAEQNVSAIYYWIQNLVRIYGRCYLRTKQRRKLQLRVSLSMSKCYYIMSSHPIPHMEWSNWQSWRLRFLCHSLLVLDFAETHSSSGYVKDGAYTHVHAFLLKHTTIREMHAIYFLQEINVLLTALNINSSSFCSDKIIIYIIAIS